MGARNRDQPYVFAIHMERELSFVSDHWERARGSWCTWRPIGSGHGMREAVAQFITRNQDRAHLLKIFVSARMVRMDVSIDDKSDGLVRKLFDRRRDFSAERRELRVHHEDAIRAGEHADRAALAIESVEV